MMRNGAFSRFRLEPIKNLATQNTVGYEVLTVFPAGVCPETYFNNISSMDMISLFMDQVNYCLDAIPRKKYFLNLTACVLANSDLCAGLPEIPVSSDVNIELQDPQSLRRMKKSERVLLTHNIHSLRNKGYKVWLDDITASLMSVLSALNITFNGIKIDKSEVLTSEPGCEKLTSIISQCKKHTSQIVVEGIENRTLLDLCIKAGATMGQGYMWKKEMLFV